MFLTIGLLFSLQHDVAEFLRSLLGMFKALSWGAALYQWMGPAGNVASTVLSDKASASVFDCVVTNGGVWLATVGNVITSLAGWLYI